LKIIESLTYQGISNDILQLAIETIDENEYRIKLESLIIQAQYKKSLYISLISRGFEEELIMECMQKMNITENQ
jgi:hypothetical protein